MKADITVDVRVTSNIGDTAKRLTLMSKVEAELARAYAKHGRAPWSKHEFYAVLLEEVDELWDAIKRDLPPEEVEAELVQVTAMLFRHFENPKPTPAT
jgi:NTP pyrophosphatase (non-canonical NTP hydrolase)